MNQMASIYYIFAHEQKAGDSLPRQKNSKKTQIRQMFDGISSDYDLMNRIITGGIDIKWRKMLWLCFYLKNLKKFWM